VLWFFRTVQLPFYQPAYFNTIASACIHPKKPVKIRTIPQADIDFKDVSEAVAVSWLANPDITLRWKKAPDFQKEVNDYALDLVSRINTGSLRPGQTNTLNQLNDVIDGGVSKVKTYIEKKYEDGDPQAQYARFGIIKENRSFVISSDRNNRKLALQQMIDAIAAEGFGAEKFGTAFWTDIQTKYNAAVAEASNTTGDVSIKVATKNERKKAISLVMSSLLMMLRANYPDDDECKGVIRQWGWKKESY
jgi:hypothetical protein